jgi:hypothetical protein
MPQSQPAPQYRGRVAATNPVRQQALPVAKSVDLGGGALDKQTRGVTTESPFTRDGETES